MSPQSTEAWLYPTDVLEHAEGTLLYYIDSCDLDVKEYHVDENRDLHNERVVTDFRVNGERPDFVPDGMTIDTDGYLYVATFGGSCVCKIDPSDGKIVQEIKLPVEQVTSVAFGGPSRNVLFVTTSAMVFKRSQPPPAGALYKVTGLGAKGAPMYSVDLN
ncbi:regucalcin-like [Toxorhynchites rutilus septentrionalis]|uniref:regucalcin-like n=1 Tax=Toxorhynchites rutilus septentrionalis TaxID=329112 RepID=UPI00247AEB52|nr:regucalcin-like [Toxorhynchites rutilus septentrionalis]